MLVLKYWVDDTDDGEEYCFVQRSLDIKKLQEGSVVYVEVWDDNTPLFGSWVEIDGGSSAEDVLQTAGKEALTVGRRMLEEIGAE